VQVHPPARLEPVHLRLGRQPPHDGPQLVRAHRHRQRPLVLCVRTGRAAGGGAALGCKLGQGSTPVGCGRCCGGKRPRSRLCQPLQVLVPDGWEAHSNQEAVLLTADAVLTSVQHSAQLARDGVRQQRRMCTPLPLSLIQHLLLLLLLLLLWCPLLLLRLLLALGFFFLLLLLPLQHRCFIVCFMGWHARFLSCLLRGFKQWFQLGCYLVFWHEWSLFCEIWVWRVSEGEAWRRSQKFGFCR